MTTYTLLSDDGHGWLSVPTAELIRLNITHKISNYSYISKNGARAYLEEDCDLSVFMAAKRAAGEEANVRVSLCHGRSWVRSLPRYCLIHREVAT